MYQLNRGGIIPFCSVSIVFSKISHVMGPPITAIMIILGIEDEPGRGSTMSNRIISMISRIVPIAPMDLYVEYFQGRWKGVPWFIVGLHP